MAANTRTSDGLQVLFSSLLAQKKISYQHILGILLMEQYELCRDTGKRVVQSFMLHTFTEVYFAESILISS